MKHHKHRLFIMGGIFALLLLGCKGPQQATTPSINPDQPFVFSVQTVNPLNGASRQVTGDYQLRFSKTDLFADLPYFGRAYSAPMNPSEGGIKIKSSSFDYHLQQKRKGWELMIRPNDQKEVSNLVLSVSENGYGTLQVTSTNRQSISYYGKVNPRN